MVYSGGSSVNIYTLVCTEWQWTISQSLVCFFCLCSRQICSPICIVATSIDVERTFSQGWLLLSHVWSRLSVQLTCALLCLGVWSSMGYVKDSDVKAVAVLSEVDGEEDELAEDWDKLTVS